MEHTQPQYARDPCVGRNDRVGFGFGEVRGAAGRGHYRAGKGYYQTRRTAKETRSSRVIKPAKIQIQPASIAERTREKACLNDVRFTICQES